MPGPIADLQTDPTTDTRSTDNHTVTSDPATPQKKDRKTSGLTPWKPGQSGNPSGRPKKLLSDRLLRRMLDDPEVVEQIVDAQLRYAAAGNFQHTREIYDRTEGAPMKAQEDRESESNTRARANALLQTLMIRSGFPIPDDDSEVITVLPEPVQPEPTQDAAAATTPQPAPAQSAPKPVEPKPTPEPEYEDI